MSVEPDGSVRREVVVDLTQDQAFIEQRVGGDVYDRGVDGSVCRWGRVVTFDPPHTLAFSWDIGPDWQVASDLTRTSEVEVIFAADGEHRSRVTLVHRHLERHGPGWKAMREGVDVEDGWPLYLARYVTLAREERDTA